MSNRSARQGALSVLGRKMTRSVIVKRLVSRGLIHVLLLAGSIVTALPFFWVISTSLKTYEEANRAKGIVWWPARPQLDAYIRSFTERDFMTYFSNSVFVTALAVLGTLISVAAVAYAFALIDWPGRNVVFLIMLSTLMLPLQTTLVPQFVLFTKIKWVGTFNPIIIPGFFAGSAMYIFLLRQFMMTLPRDIFEAAVIDGASHLQIWWRIVIPLCRPILATIAVFLFVAHWNSFQQPLIYLKRESMYTLPVYVANLRNPQIVEQDWPLIMAFSALTMIPPIIAFFFAQRYVLEAYRISGQH